MKKFLLLFFSFSFLVYAGSRHTRSELESMSKPELVRLALDLEKKLYGDDDFLDCISYRPLQDEAGVLMQKDYQGSLKWPNGNKFLYRWKGYNRDKELYYPNGKEMVKRWTGMNSDKKVFWPNEKVLMDRWKGHSSDGRMFHADGSKWLERSRGYSSDGQIFGSPIEYFKADGFEVKARIAENYGLRHTTKVYGDEWTIEVLLEVAETKARATLDYEHKVLVIECFKN